MEEFSLKLLKIKYFGALILFLILSTGLVYISISGFFTEDTAIPVSVMLFFFSLLPIYFTIRLIKMWRFKNELIEISNGYVINHSTFLSNQSKFEINNIEYIWAQTNVFGKIHQIVIYQKKKVKFEVKRNFIQRFIQLFMDQLMGQNLYIPDFFIGKKQLKNLYEYLNSKIK